MLHALKTELNLKI